MAIEYKLKAQFFPVSAGQDGFIGSAAITVADAILLRGIAVFQNREDRDLTICFPTFGKHRQSYILPLSQTAYHRMHHLIGRAATDGSYTAEEQGATNLSMSIDALPADSQRSTDHFSLTLPSFCCLNGIICEEMPYALPNGQKIAVRMPTLIPAAGQGSPLQEFTVFHGLLTPTILPDGTPVLKDYQKIIDDLVRAKREELMQNRAKPEQTKQENNIPSQNQPIR